MHVKLESYQSQDELNFTNSNLNNILDSNSSQGKNNKINTI